MIRSACLRTFCTWHCQNKLVQQQHDHIVQRGCPLSVVHAFGIAAGVSQSHSDGCFPCDTPLMGDISLLLAKTVSIESGMDSHAGLLLQNDTAGEYHVEYAIGGGHACVS